MVGWKILARDRDSGKILRRLSTAHKRGSACLIFHLILINNSVILIKCNVQILLNPILSTNLIFLFNKCKIHNILKFK